MHDLIFADQKNIGVDGLKAKAGQIAGLDTATFNSCLDNSKHKTTVAKDMEDGVQAGVSGTPAFFVNGRFLSGAVPFDSFSEIIDDELKRKGIS